MPDLRLNYSSEEIERRFFKYANREAARTILESGTLRWSTPGTLNDPYDMQFNLHVEVDRDEVKRLALEKLWEAHYGLEEPSVGNVMGLLIRAFRGSFPRFTREEFEQEYGEAIEEGLNRFERALPRFHDEIHTEISRSKILCLSEIADSSPMWAYYAENHQGVVLKFRSIAEFDSPWVTARRIEYHDDMPRLLDADFLADLAAGRIALDARTILDRLIYTKSSAWAHEREWRIYTGDGRAREAAFEDVPFHPIELEAVIFGCRMPVEEKGAFSDLIAERYPHAQLLQAQRDEKNFRLNIAPAVGRMISALSRPHCAIRIHRIGGPPNLDIMGQPSVFSNALMRSSRFCAVM